MTVSAEPPPSQPQQNNPQPQPQPQPRPSQYNIFNMPLPDDPEFWRLVNNS
ncbi:hypothetical protein GQ42DRAFT_55508 [Ramicandelaber brevisporus]|nr:hypothetical protein GQ42DRAFT_55508 [Ramicandelaber brevisporus]